MTTLSPKPGFDWTRLTSGTARQPPERALLLLLGRHPRGQRPADHVGQEGPKHPFLRRVHGDLVGVHA